MNQSSLMSDEERPRPDWLSDEIQTFNGAAELWASVLRWEEEESVCCSVNKVSWRWRRLSSVWFSHKNAETETEWIHSGHCPCYMLPWLQSDGDVTGDLILYPPPPEPMCYDWGESSEGAVSVVEGEAGWLSCPLFSHPSVYNYTSTQRAGHNLVWYRLPKGHDLEQPIRDRYDRRKFWSADCKCFILFICWLTSAAELNLFLIQIDEMDLVIFL